MSNYESARELLTQLGTLARSLSSGLDDVSIGYSLLTDLEPVLDPEVSVVYLWSAEQRLLPLSVKGADTITWTTDDFQAAWDTARETNAPQITDTALPGTNAPGHVVIPLGLGEDLVGAVVAAGPKSSYDSPDPDHWTDSRISQAFSITQEAAIKIDTARLFGEIQEIATIEERRRLAREIHDGIAQEIASLGYVVDDIAADAVDDTLKERVLELRGELSRVVSELRLSIFDLRSDVQPETGLGAAISSYVRQVGTSTGLTVHLVLDETATRLPVSVESELLRIAQEAITNVRKHAQASNLWTSCRINPPQATLRIADDGVGVGEGREDSYGLEIMRERAARVGAKLTVRGREGGGTVVELVL